MAAAILANARPRCHISFAFCISIAVLSFEANLFLFQSITIIQVTTVAHIVSRLGDNKYTNNGRVLRPVRSNRRGGGLRERRSKRSGRRRLSKIGHVTVGLHVCCCCPPVLLLYMCEKPRERAAPWKAGKLREGCLCEKTRVALTCKSFSRILMLFE